MVQSVDGITIEPLAWALAFGACFSGNGTLIGSRRFSPLRAPPSHPSIHIN